MYMLTAWSCFWLKITFFSGGFDSSTWIVLLLQNIKIGFCFCCFLAAYPPVFSGDGFKLATSPYGQKTLFLNKCELAGIINQIYKIVF